MGNTIVNINPQLVIGIVIIGHCLGILNAVHAIMNVRLPQSAIAWSLSLILFPWLVMPLYWVLGRRKFIGYAEAYQEAYQKYQTKAVDASQKILAYAVDSADNSTILYKLALSPFTFPLSNSAFYLWCDIELLRRHGWFLKLHLLLNRQ